MCGIFAYTRSKDGLKRKQSPVDICIKGLKLLEYRGYDSSGIAGIIDGKIRACKRAGNIEALQQAALHENLRLETVIAHTRWATHGIVNEQNAHPHFDEHHSLAVVHNGIVENHTLIRQKLTQAGAKFYSDTDTEVIAALISYYYEGDIRVAVQKALSELKGSLALALIHQDHPDQIIGVSRESPLVVGINRKNKEGYLASDIHSFNGKTLEVLYLKNGELIVLGNDHFAVYDADGKEIETLFQHITLKATSAQKKGFDHYMLKEIFEQPKTIQQAILGRFREEFGTAEFDELTLSAHFLQGVHRILILGCGSSWHAGLVGASILEGLSRIPTDVKIASEFRYTDPIICEKTLVLAISQSGETADMIGAVREAKSKGAKVVALCNVNHSTLVREADASLFLKAGPEISVCSTKAFTSQLTVLALFSLYLGRLRHLNKEEGQHFLKDLAHLPQKVSEVLAQQKEIQIFAEKYASFEHFSFIGRQSMYPTSLEAALKLKETSYLNANGLAAGEMKHGAMALVNPELAIIALCGNLHTLNKMLSNLMEVKARGGVILAFAPKGTQELTTITQDIIWMPQVSDALSSIPYSVAGQLFAYFIAKSRGTNIDQPRNLAKSVTVE